MGADAGVVWMILDSWQGWSPAGPDELAAGPPRTQERIRRVPNFQHANHDITPITAVTQDQTSIR